MTTRATAAALAAACEAGGLRAVRLLLEQGAPVTAAAWRAAAARADPALVFLLETSDLRRDPPAWLEAALTRADAEADFQQILDALHGPDQAARRVAAQRLLAAQDAGLVLEPALRRRALAVWFSHSPEEAALLEQALARGLGEQAARGAGLAEGRAVRLAASVLATAALGRQPVDWEGIDGWRAQASPAVREGAVSALATAWTGHVETAAIARRLLDALGDASEDVRRAAAVRLATGLREGRVTTDALRARLPVDAARSGGPLGDLARTTEAVVEARQRHGCDACGALGAEAEWGESIGGPDTPEPPEMTHLRRVATQGGSTDVYRCSQCGAYFELATHEETFISGNSTWYSYTLTRWIGPTDELEVYEAARTSDSARLRGLLEAPDEAARVRRLEAVARLVHESYDVAAVQPALRELAGPGPPPKVRGAAASVLALHALRVEAVQEVVALVESGDEAPRAAALRALVQAKEHGWAAAVECARRVRPTLWALAAEKGELRYAAIHLLSTAALGPDTLQQALANLDTDRRTLREAAADVIAAAAEARLDVGAALPRLAALLADAEMGADAAKALGAAHLRGADLAPFVTDLAAFVRARPRSSQALSVTHILHALQERGVDIAAAFEALAVDGGDWPMSVLQHAVERSRDVEPAVPELQRMASEEQSYLGRIAVEILAAHFARKQDWGRLTPLLQHPLPERADAARTAVERAALQEQAPLEALYLLGRLQAGDAPADPKRTTWSQDRDNLEVNDREVLRWTEDGRGGIGASCSLDAFLAGEAQRDVFRTFGARTLNEVVEAARRIARQRKG